MGDGYLRRHHLARTFSVSRRMELARSGVTPVACQGDFQNIEIDTCIHTIRSRVQNLKASHRAMVLPGQERQDGTCVIMCTDLGYVVSGS